MKLLVELKHHAANTQKDREGNQDMKCNNYQFACKRSETEIGREREGCSKVMFPVMSWGKNINEQHRQILAAVCKPEEILCVCQGWISPCLPRSLAVFRRFFARTGDFHSVSLAPSFSLCRGAPLMLCYVGHIGKYREIM